MVSNQLLSLLTLRWEVFSKPFILHHTLTPSSGHDRLVPSFKFLVINPQGNSFREIERAIKELMIDWGDLMHLCSQDEAAGGKSVNGGIDAAGCEKAVEVTKCLHLRRRKQWI